MKNNENQEPITGAIQQGVSLRQGHHPYEGHKHVVELRFKSYNCDQIIVIDMETALDLQKQLEFLL